MGRPRIAIESDIVYSCDFSADGFALDWQASSVQLQARKGATDVRGGDTEVMLAKAATRKGYSITLVSPFQEADVELWRCGLRVSEVHDRRMVGIYSEVTRRIVSSTFRGINAL